MSGWGIEQEKDSDMDSDSYCSSAHSSFGPNQFCPVDETKNSEQKEFSQRFPQLSPILRTSQSILQRVSKLSRHRSIKSQTELEPLVLSSSAIDGESLIQKQRSQFMFKIGLSSKPSVTESTKFLERFRYLLVSSQLLDKQFVVSIYRTPKDISPQRKQHAGQVKNVSRTKIRRIISMLNSAGSAAGKWKTSSGCVMVLIVILAWALKHHRIKQEHTAWLALGFITFLYLYSYGRRQSIRNLRARILVSVEEFVDQAKRFDGTISRTIQTVKEIELMSRGYRPDLGLGLDSHFEVPIGRIAKREDIVKGKHLRSCISSCLYLSMTSYLDSIQNIIPFCEPMDLDKYLDIYELDLSVISEFGSNFEINTDEANTNSRAEYILKALNISKNDFYGIEGANAPLQKLKTEFFKLNFLRRAYICCLLSLPITSKGWSLVEEQLDSNSILASQLCRTLHPDSRTFTLASSSSEDDEIANISHKSFSKLYSGFQHIESRIEMLRDDDTKTESAYTNYTLLGDDIRSLLDTWESLKQEYVSTTLPLPTTKLQTSKDPLSPELFSPSSATTLTSSNGNDFFSMHHRRQSSEFTTLSGATVILEGIAPDRFARQKQAGLTREERIERMKQEREREIERKKELSERSNLIVELDSVLNYRRKMV